MAKLNTVASVQNAKENTVEFDNFGYVKRIILKKYANNLLKGENVKTFTIEIKNYMNNQFVFGWLNKVGALKVESVNIEEVVDTDTGKLSKVYHIGLKDFDINTRATSKENKEFAVFSNKDLGSAIRAAM